MKKILLSLLLIVSSIGFVSAEGVSFKASAPNSVGAGQAFQLVYTVNETGKDFRLPSLNGFEVLAGPYTSTSSSTTIINGKITSSKEIRYTYTIQANSQGTFTIPSASIVVDGQKYNSNALTIKVLPEDKAAAASQGGGGSSGRGQGTSSAGNATSADRLFVRAIISRTKVMEQEAILVTYKLYSKEDIVGFEDVKLPDFKDFMVQEIELPKERGLQRESYNGSQYLTYEIYKGVLFPQHAGTLAIDRFKCVVDVRVRVQRQSRSFFDSFFESYQDVQKELSTTKTDIIVTPLPKPKPADFSGIVGSLQMSKNVSATEVKSNQPITIKLTLTGSGNMKILNAPELNFPMDFETYEPKVTNNFKTSANGQSGTKIIEYLVIPRHNGEFTIPSASLSYFDVNSNTYKTLQTGDMNFKILKGEGEEEESGGAVLNAREQEKVEMLAKDIHYLNTGSPNIRKPESFIVNTPFYWLSFVVMLIVTALLVILFRKQAADNANVALMKNRKANKMARKRLKIADREWRAGNREVFYDEVLKALWGYVSDKLSMPVADLNKENISASLAQRGVSEEMTVRFVELLNECEFQRYAPVGDVKTAMDKTYREAIDVISELDNQIRK
ncbi:MAG: BatD family protein [Paludibacteraceae bacterium]|nr:BatD family protein [Paludibacteraceae bacterium]